MFDKIKKALNKEKVLHETEKETIIKPYTLAGVTFDDRQNLIKHLKLREELKIEKYEYNNETAFKVLNSEGKQIGSIRKNDISSLDSIYNKIKKCKVLGTNNFENENNEIIISCQIGVEYYV